MIPNMKSTQDAWKFGENATEEQVELMKRVRNVCLNQFENLFEAEDDSDEILNLMSEIATQSQYMREAIEMSNHQ